MEEEFRYDEFAPKQFIMGKEKYEKTVGQKTAAVKDDFYVVLELLTSGENPRSDLLYEISGVKYQNDEEIDSFQELVRPENYYLLSKEEALRKEDYCIIDGGAVYFMEKYMCSMTGITNQMLYDARPQQEVLKAFYEFIGEARLIGDQLSWQLPFLKELFEECGLSIKKEKEVAHTSREQEVDGDFSLEGKVCVFTGTLTHMVRGQAMGLLRSVGGICGTSISKKTDVLILGNKEEQARLRGEKSTKLRKAERLISEGNSLRLLSEDAFYCMVGYKKDL